MRKESRWGRNSSTHHQDGGDAADLGHSRFKDLRGYELHRMLDVAGVGGENLRRYIVLR
jgi:hypothetical protein